jgi:WXXGXW repeat (2 copies)
MRHLVRGLFAVALLAVLPATSQAGLFVSVTIAPPALPVYVQPPIPGPGYLWTPGYWAWDGSYYWVPGTWVLAPVGLLWTPGYWGWSGGVYLWHAGYWGPHVGFYGGVNYGFGYGGVGFVGGEWRGGQLYYNRSVTNITSSNITNVYNRTVVNNVSVNRVSYTGGAGGIVARPNAAEMAAEHERHTAPMQAQAEHQTMAAHNNAMRASVNGGRPSVAATQRAGVFTGAGLVAARGAAATHGGGHGGAYPQGGAAPAHGGAYPQSAHSPTHGGAYPQGGGYPQPHAGGYPQPHASPGHAEPGHNGQGRGNERPERPEGHEERPR